jgi:hypothetical protein
MEKHWKVKFYNNQGVYFEDYIIKSQPELIAQAMAENVVGSRTDIHHFILEELPLLEAGEYFSSGRGIYIGRDVQMLAMQYGWPEDKAVVNMDDENYLEAWMEATAYLNDFVPEGYYADDDEGGWGVYKIEDEYDGYDDDIWS